MYDVPMPFAPGILSAFEAMGLGDEFKFPASAFAELEGCDMSDVCMVMNHMPMVMSGQEHTAGPHMLRESFDELRKQMAPYEKEHGLPLIDNLVINIFGLVIPTFKSVGCFSDFWKEAEKLVDEGLVRSLSINAATIHQIESLLEFARHRPVMASFESSPLAPLP